MSTDCTLKSTCVHQDGVSVIETEVLGPCNPADHKVCVPDAAGIYQCVCQEGYETTANGCELIGAYINTNA